MIVNNVELFSKGFQNSKLQWLLLKSVHLLRFFGLKLDLALSCLIGFTIRNINNKVLLQCCVDILGKNS